jgi:hypothetical protein
VTGVPASPSGLRPFGAEPQASQAEPLVPNAEHTPLPWSISYGFDRGGSRADYVAGPNPKSIGIKLASPWIEGAWDDDAEAKANAAFIVRACNSHYALVEALVEALRHADPIECSAWAGKATRALAEARGKA